MILTASAILPEPSVGYLVYKINVLGRRVRIEDSTRIWAPIETVWELFTELGRWQDWNTVLTDPEPVQSRLEAGSRIRCIVRPLFFAMSVDLQIEAVEKTRRVVWNGRRLGISSRHEFLFSPGREGEIRVISREDFSGFPPFMGLLPLMSFRLRDLTGRLLHDLERAAEGAVIRDDPLDAEG